MRRSNFGSRVHRGTEALTWRNIKRKLDSRRWLSLLRLLIPCGNFVCNVVDHRLFYRSKIFLWFYLTPNGRLLFSEAREAASKENTQQLPRCIFFEKQIKAQIECTPSEDDSALRRNRPTQRNGGLPKGFNINIISWCSARRLRFDTRLFISAKVAAPCLRSRKSSFKIFICGERWIIWKIELTN